MNIKKEKLFSGGIFDYDQKKNNLNIINLELENPEIWNNVEKIQNLLKDKKNLEKIVNKLDFLKNNFEDYKDIFLLAQNDKDYNTMNLVKEEINKFKSDIEELEFNMMFTNSYDSLNCFIDIQSGAGGTESQDWAAMLMRQYIRYAERKNFQIEILEQSNGEIIGIKSATLKIMGDYAFGYLRTESGIHRLVRKSPFDSSGNRHTSFASIFVYPEINDSINININISDLKIDTYRASGAGGQHINKTDSAVRITHIPTNIVVQCQGDRSQHRNKQEAMQMLKSKLYDLELKNRNLEQKKLEDSKSEVAWGHQIRSYVLDQSRIKDLRTNIEISDTQKVLDGDLDIFIMANLKHNI
ncbi:Peptide chain release factor RF2 [Candidatus Kinetoplastibacterium sorsogonicusi]|uniref:Peptide chain release factor 2 n=1 Tax=Candidatus Kinetoplastidibacterium kentomonadis TaxID=1576550 RepID=A0A3Q8EWV5_9PROT|nr:Peptide chain release factor RF2 [Candidatus Kinetoplastibacterium sorsogonicusi]